MRRGSMLFVLLVSTAGAYAQAERTHPEPPIEERNDLREAEADQLKHDTPAYIAHHVSDSDEFELDLPLVVLKPGQEEPHIRFPVWRIPLKEGACPADPHTHAELTKGCLDLSITKHAFMMFIAAAALLALMLVGAHRDNKRLVPKGPLAHLLEMLVLFVRNEIAISNIGKEEGPRYVPYLLTIFFFILSMNLLGLFPWASTPTGNIAITAALAACTFVLTQVASIRAAGLGGYLKHLTGGTPWPLWPIMIPVEVLGLFTKPFALTLRLFANMLAGHMVLFSLLGLIFMVGSVAVAVAAVPFAIGIYLLELFVAFLQAYIFTMLSAVFIGMGVAMGHHAHDEHHHPGEAKPEEGVSPANAPG